MPLLYGEGAEKAFVRLQLELIKKSSDETIFAWTSPWGGSPLFMHTWLGLLAPSPKAFRGAAHICEHMRSLVYQLSEGNKYEITNRGIHLTCFAHSVQQTEWRDYYCLLACHSPGTDNRSTKHYFLKLEAYNNGYYRQGLVLEGSLPAECEGQLEAFEGYIEQRGR